mmetsp:Transcript_88542/g.277265  ORF Transcript_88542/g.277265 Transcript_88542/m.277265 type:complete len:621 (+) Transcript_88542:99-1961(+)
MAGGAQLRDDMRALLEEQWKSLSNEIRAGFERQTQAIEQLAVTLQQGQAVKEWRYNTVFNVSDGGNQRRGQTAVHPAETHGGGSGAEGNERRGPPHRATLFGMPESEGARISRAHDRETQAAKLSRVAELIKDEMEEKALANKRWCWCIPARWQRGSGERGGIREFRKAVKDATLSATFDLACGMLILCNAALIGAEVEYEATHEGEPNPVFTDLQNAFGVIFLLELMLRLHAEGRKFLRPPGWKWNVFDLVLVSTFVADFASSYISTSSATDLSSTFAGRILRAARFCRILRTLRLVRATSYAHEFRKMAYALQHSVHTLFWALLLLFVIIYCFATTFTQASTEFLSNHKELGYANITQFCNDDGTARPSFASYRHVCELATYWGNLPKSLYFLYACLSGGVNWTYVVTSLSHADWTFAALFMIYISVSFFGVLNVVTSVFVECAMASTQHFMDLKIQEANNQKKVHLNHLREVFRDVDTDSTGEIAIVEMEELLKNDHLSSYLESIDIRKDDAMLLFQLLDKDGSGLISIEEFCEGCMRLKGEAKSFDIHRLVWDTEKLMKRLSALAEHVDDRMVTMSMQLHRLDKLSPSLGAEEPQVDDSQLSTDRPMAQNVAFFSF